MREIKYIELQPRPRSLFMQIVGLIVGLGVLAVSVLLGAFLLAGFRGFALIVGTVIYVRLWWLRRQAMRAANDEFIETEYQVVRTRREGSDRH